jgi:uncharacterized OB-fold protein
VRGDERVTVPVDGPRPLPVPNELSKPYWDSCRRHELTFVRCRSCGHGFFPPAQACIKCLSGDLVWERSSGRGVIDSYTVIEKEPSPGFPLPTVLATINLEEGHYMFSDIVECDPSEVACDLPVEVVFYAVTEEITLPMFRLVRTDVAR